MATLGLVALTVIFALLTWDSWQFRHSARFRMWDGIPPPEFRYGDYFSKAMREQLQNDELRATGGVPGLHWAFGVLTAGSGFGAAWAYFS